MERPGPCRAAREVLRRPSRADRPAAAGRRGKPRDDRARARPMKWSTLQDFEDEARRKLPRAHYDYFSGGAQDEVTLRTNRAEFTGIMMRAGVLRGDR